jgi:hypothetical protein
MWGKRHPKDNPESWQDIHHFIAEYPDDANWSRWKSMVSDAVSALEARGLVELFRIGQSMHHVIISTLEHHRITSEPRVTLSFNAKEETVRVAYSCSNLWFNAPLSEETVQISAAVPTTLRYLRRLWSETKPATSIPDALNAP